MLRVKPISCWQFTAFRFLFGAYLLAHSLALLPYGKELFSRDGALAHARLNPTFGLFPDPLYLWDSPRAVAFLLILMAFLAMLFALGTARHLAAAFLWFGWASLFGRNNLISNPSIPYVGLLLLLTLLIPAGEPLSLWPRRRTGWEFPFSVYAVAGLLLAAGYTYSGCVKLASPSWLDGSALRHLLDNPLARPGPMREALIAAPQTMLRLASWTALAIEVAALPLALPRRTRPWIWLATGLLQIGILSMIAFADLTIGMLMAHIFTFDPAWLPARRRAGARQLVLYDGVCGLCNRSVGFLLAEDRAAALTFAPLQGPTAVEILRRHKVAEGLLSIVFVRDHGTSDERTFVRSAAVIAILGVVGGFWRLFAGLWVIPRPFRDAIYDWVARRRYGWFGKLDACLLPEPAVRARFLD